MALLGSSLDRVRIASPLPSTETLFSLNELFGSRPMRVSALARASASITVSREQRENEYSQQQVGRGERE